jgi:hypothetical protein
MSDNQDVKVTQSESMDEALKRIAQLSKDSVKISITVEMNLDKDKLRKLDSEGITTTSNVVT